MRALRESPLWLPYFNCTITIACSVVSGNHPYGAPCPRSSTVVRAGRRRAPAYANCLGHQLSGRSLVPEALFNDLSTQGSLPLQ